MNKLMSVLLGGMLLVGGAAYAQNTGAQPDTRAQTGQTGTMGGHMMNGQMMGGNMSCGDMMGKADVKVEKTTHGAIIRMTAKDPKDVAAVQQHAEMMSSCMGMMKKPTTK